MKNRTIIIYRYSILIIVLFCHSCIYLRMSHLTNEELAWVEVYREGDSCFFKSNLGDYDIIVINEITIHNRINPYNPKLWNSGYDYTANACIDFDFITRNFSDNYFFIKKEIDEDILVFSSRLDTRASLYITPIVKTFTIDSKSFDDCILFDDRNSYLIHSKQNPVKSYIWSKSKGLIQYTLEDGETFQLTKVKPKAKERFIFD